MARRPILGRGVTGDTMLVHRGTAATVTPTVRYRKKGAATFSTATGTGSCAGTRCDWEVLLSGLELDGAYEYQVESDPATYELRTCPATGTPMDVIFYGDSRDGEVEHQKIVRGALAHDPDMVFESGDIQGDGTYAGYLAGFFVTAKPLLPTVPFQAVPGNHDANADLATNYARLFPTAGRTLGDAGWRSYSAFTCGASMFIGLDSNRVSASDAQTTFLKAQLATAAADPRIDHVFVWFHHAPFSPGQHGDNAAVQSAWVPLFEAPGNKVAAVFSGHDHIYAHMNDGSRVAYFVSGGAGAPAYTLTSTSRAMTVKAVGGPKEYNFVKVHIAGAYVRATAYDDQGTVIEDWDNGQSAPVGVDGGTGGGGGGADLGVGVDAGVGDPGAGGAGGGAGGGGPMGATSSGGCSVGGASGELPAALLVLALVGLALRRWRATVR